MSAHPKKFCVCGHAQALHHHPNVAAGSPCVLVGCACYRFERRLAIDTPADAEARRAARLMVEQLWTEVKA